MDIKILVIVLVSIIAVNATKISYEGYKLYKVVPVTEDQVKSLQNIKEDGLGIFWEDYIVMNNKVKVMVSVENEEEFVQRTKSADLEAKLAIENLQRAIDDQLTPAEVSSRNSEPFHSMNWNYYHSLEDIYSWLDELVAAYPNIVSPAVMGNSFENRPIRGIVINFNPDITYPNVGIIEGTIHAREWITSSTVTWIIKEFLTSEHPDIRELAESFEWHIFPVVNPDGFAYTFTTNRMWRKNRNTSYFTSCNATQVSDDMSNGVDLNRNFDFVWNTTGTNPDPCSNLYPGPSGASEPETVAISQYVQNLNERANLVYYLAFHSYTQLVVIPYSHINGFEVVAATNYADMYEIAIRGAEKMKQRYGTRYTVGVSPDIMYPMSGTSFDWVKFATQVPVAYLIELRDMGEFGFLLPPSQIIPTAMEAMDFLLEMNRNTKIMGYYSLPASGASTIGSLGAILVGIALMI